jgi:cytoskeletal protein RodZ
MEDFSYPIKLEPLRRPRSRQAPDDRPQPKGQRPPARDARPKRRTARPPSGLAELRERHGISLREIADQTRIPLRHLQELERGDVRNWPGGVYARSWARDYANLAGIDPDRVIAIVAPLAEIEPTIEEIKEVTEQRERASADGIVPLTPLMQLTRRVAAIALVLMLLVFALLFFWNREPDPAEPRGGAPVGTSGVTTPGQPPR